MPKRNIGSHFLSVFLPVRSTVNALRIVSVHLLLKRDDDATRRGRVSSMQQLLVLAMRRKSIETKIQSNARALSGARRK